jgi:hypothetical protein
MAERVSVRQMDFTLLTLAAEYCLECGWPWTTGVEVSWFSCTPGYDGYLWITDARNDDEPEDHPGLTGGPSHVCGAVCPTCLRLRGVGPL